MPSYDYIYGSKVIVQCKGQINIHKWTGDSAYSQYISVIKKQYDFFDLWFRLKGNVKCIVREPPLEEIDSEIKKYVGTEIDDELQERNRVVGWSKKENSTVSVVPRGGHRGQSLPLKTAFCARDQGIKINLPNYTSSK